MNWANAIGSAILHSLWQGLAALLVVELVRRSTRDARLRHTVAVGALTAMLVGFVAAGSAVAPIEGGAGARIEAREALAAPGRIVAPAAGLAALLPWLSWSWAFGVVALAGYRIAGWRLLRRIRTEAVCAVDPQWQERFETLCRRLAVGRPARLLESGLTPAPVVIGWLRPVVLMPVGLLAAMPVAQVEAILMHELAHVVRRDSWVRWLQQMAESVMFYHPAVWRISRVVNEEREKCCDDFVVANEGDAGVYAAALIGLESVRLEPALAANGGELMKRIERLLGRREQQEPLAALLVPALLLAGLCGAAVWAQQPATPTRYDNWLNQDVVYIIDAQERAAFVALKTDDERDKFIEQFWKRRDPKPETVVNEFKEEHYRRIAWVNSKWPSARSGWRTDRGRMYIVYGPPDEMEVHPDSEAWLYRHIDGKGDRVIFRFGKVGDDFVLKP